MLTSSTLRISACFLVGFVVTICSIIRITKLQNLQDSHNETWNVSPAGLWSLIEVYCSLICCCMPAMAGLVKRCWRWARDQPSTYLTQESDSVSRGVGGAGGEKEEEEQRWKDEKSKEQDSPVAARRRSSAAGSTKTEFVPRALSPVHTRRADFRKSY